MADRLEYEALLEELQSCTWIIRSDAAETLGELGDRAAVVPLNKVLQGDEPHIALHP